VTSALRAARIGAVGALRLDATIATLDHWAWPLAAFAGTELDGFGLGREPSLLAAAKVQRPPAALIRTDLRGMRHVSNRREWPRAGQKAHDGVLPTSGIATPRLGPRSQAAVRCRLRCGSQNQCSSAVAASQRAAITPSNPSGTTSARSSATTPKRRFPSRRGWYMTSLVPELAALPHGLAVDGEGGCGRSACGPSPGEQPAHGRLRSPLRG